MAITYRTTTTNTGSGTSAIGNVPSGVVADDVLIAFISTPNGGAAPPFTGPGGWTRLDVMNPGANRYAESWYRVAGGSEPASYTWTISSSNWRVDIAAGVGASSTINANRASAALDSVAPTDALAPSVTTTVDGCSVVCGWTTMNATPTSWTLPGGITSLKSDLTSPSIVMGYFVVAVAGASGDQTAQANGVATRWGAFQVALAPAPTGHPAARRLASNRPVEIGRTGAQVW